MQIWRAHELGDPLDVLRIDDAAEPEPGAGQVVVRIEATGLAFPDVLMCQGKYQAPTTLPFSPGGEWAGTVLATPKWPEGTSESSAKPAPSSATKLSSPSSFQRCRSASKAVCWVCLKAAMLSAFRLSSAA